MKLLGEIPVFPRSMRETLETQYGIESAEAFYDLSVHNPDGLRRALGVSDEELDRLVKTVEGYLSPERIALSHQPLVKRPRGLGTDRYQPKASKP
jgi:hypothetical protein